MANEIPEADVKALFLRLIEGTQVPDATEVPVLVGMGISAEEREKIRLRTSSGVMNMDAPDDQPTVYLVQRSPTRVGSVELGITFGRADGNDVVLADASISRLHGYLVPDKRGKVWRIYDAESRNGTWVNGKRLSPNVPSSPAGGEVLPDGATVKIGRLELLFLLPETYRRHLKTARG